jgi:hypothetical protein
MLKLVDILEEGALQLTPEERQQVENMLPDIIKIISGKNIGDNRYIPIGDINAISADKTPIKVEIRVGNDLSVPNANGYFQTLDPKNPTDNYIFLQQPMFSPYFKGLSGFDKKATKFLAGDENLGVERLRKTLKHELIHAKDPALNQHYLKEPYDSSNAAVYYKSWAEFQSMTGQFFEAITTGVDRALKLGKDKNQILGALNNILEYYSGKTKNFNTYAKDFIQGTGKRNIFQSLIKLVSDFVLPLDSSIDSYAGYLSLIKKYNPEGYKEFLKDLYKTIDQAKDKLNNLQEMEYINEAKRFQQLAGIITEAETKQSAAPADDPEIDAAMKAGLSVLTTEAKFLDEIKDENQPQELNESVLALIGSGLLAAPKIIEWIGKAIAFISKPFMKNKDENAIAEKIVHFAHKWEKLYLKAIIWTVKKTKFVQQIWMTPDGSVDEQKLVVVAKYIYAGILAVAMGQAIGAVLGPSSTVIKAIEGSLGTVKAVEIAQIASKIKGQL